MREEKIRRESGKKDWEKRRANYKDETSREEKINQDGSRVDEINTRVEEWHAVIRLIKQQRLWQECNLNIIPFT